MAAITLAPPPPTTSTPTPLAGSWLHSTRVADAIIADGWQPEMLKSTMFGAGVYMARAFWDDHQTAIECVLDIRDDCSFRDFSGDPTYEPFTKLISAIGGGVSAAPGSSISNRLIRDHFLKNRVQAVLFSEGAPWWDTIFGSATPVVVVYDLTCIHAVRVQSRQPS